MKTDFEKTAMRVSVVNIISHFLLAVFKVLAGVIGHSSAMISDGINSASDLFSTFVVMAGIKMAGKKSDKEHPYGHERMECVAAIILATILSITGLILGYDALQKIAGGHYQDLQAPGMLALIAAIVSMVVKECMYWYTKLNAQKIDSSALMAVAWDHRSDALSSGGALIGIIGARMGYPVLDAVASLVICILILKATFDIFKDALDKMVDKACDEETEAAIRECVLGHEGVLGIDMLQTRVFGNKIYVDLEILADGNKTVHETHAIAEQVHDSIEENFPKVKHIMVHVNPK